MQTIGERLLEARQRRGVSIREAAEATKVRGDYLMAMEANQFDNIPLADVYKRGFLKIYARFLRLDADRIIGEYNGLLAARMPHGAKVRRVTELNETSGRPSELREPEAPDEFASGAIEFAERPDNRNRTLAIAAILAVCVIGVTVAGVKSCGSDSPEKTRANAPADPSAASGEIRLTCVNNIPTAVRLVRLSDNTPVFDRTLRPQETAVIPCVGAHELYANPLDKIHYSINGAPAMVFQSGHAKGPVTIPPKGA